MLKDMKELGMYPYVPLKGHNDCLFICFAVVHFAFVKDFLRHVRKHLYSVTNSINMII